MNSYIALLRSIGAPVDRALAQSRLPSNIEETPNAYISIPVAIEWIAATGRDLKPMELGFLCAQTASLSSLHPTQQAIIATAQTGLTRLQALAMISRFEDSALDVWIVREEDRLRIACDMTGLGRHPFICLAEWLNLQAIISVVRSVAGRGWCPQEMCFASPHRPPDAVLGAFPDTRVLVGQPHSSVVVQAAELALPTDSTAELAEHRAHRPRDAQPEIWEFVNLLRMTIQPYLGEGRTDIAFAAEIAGVSTRTLQRRLRMSGTSYSRILQEARFDLARSLLDDRGAKVIDVAMLAGYESPQHFTRAFRRFTGMTPSSYRGA